MNNAFSRLLKVLALERKQGYRNKAVIGGLDKFASRWERQRAPRPTIGPRSARSSRCCSATRPSRTRQRERIIDQVIRRAGEIDAPHPASLGAGAAPAPAPAEQTEAASGASATSAAARDCR